MNKQDRQGVRTPADLERKYHFGKNMGEAKKAAYDASRAAERAVAAAGQSIGREEYDQIVAMLNRATAMITRLVVQSGGFTLDAEGNMAAQSIKLGGKDLETRLAAIEAKLGIDGSVEYRETDGGTKVVGETWNLMDGAAAGLFSITSITGGVEIVQNNAQDGVILRATTPGTAVVIVESEFLHDTVTYNIVSA